MAGYAPSQAFEHAQTPLKGWFQPAALDFAAKLSSNVTITAYGGRVVHVNAAGEFEMGIANTQMPIFLIQGSQEYDVSNPSYTVDGTFVQEAILPDGVMNGLVGTGGYEIQTTEHDKTPQVSYLPNQLLTAKNSNSNQTTGGVLSNDRNGAGGTGGAVRQYVDAACGVVSRGQYKNEHGVLTLAFWPIYLPAAFA